MKVCVNKDLQRQTDNAPIDTSASTTETTVPAFVSLSGTLFKSRGGKDIMTRGDWQAEN
jgi:hypothetical protein